MLSFFATDSCSLLVPVWFVVVTRFMEYMYTSGLPIWHLAISAERFVATLRSGVYEKRSNMQGIVSSVLVWIASGIPVSVVFGLAFLDDDFHGSLVYTSVTTSTNGKLILVNTYIWIGFDVAATGVDVMILLINRRRNLRRVSTDYSLTHKYQINENVSVTTGLVLPITVCNSAFYITFMVICAVLRNIGGRFEPAFSESLFEFCCTLLVVPMPLTLLIVLRYATKVRQVEVMDVETQKDVYFQYFRAQLGHASTTKSATRRLL
ncbi:hypothetical protein AAVH_11892 [Aphelenchoides avenae]|nr:hypothetical protein AAVH_11892 [Aphelenchus avenae]